MYVLVAALLFSSACSQFNATTENYLKWKKDFSIPNRVALKKSESRLEIWKKFVERHGLHNVNPYSDLTEAERKEMFKYGWQEIRNTTGSLVQHKWVDFPSDMVALALSSGRDWRAEGKTTSAKNQGQQPYCGTFSRVGAAESTYAIGGGFKTVNKRQNPLTDFSVEEVVDCCGWDKSQDDVFFNKGFMSWNAYPFDTSNHAPDNTQPCRYNSGLKIPGSTMDGWVHQTCGSDKKACEDQMATWIYYNGPMQGGITAEVFYNADAQHFVTAAQCNILHFDHGIIYAGFGTDPVKGNYWLIKNSWGNTWQDRGFIKVARGVNCGGLAGSAMAYITGDSEDYFPGPNTYLGYGICSIRIQISSSASSVDEARAQSKANSWCKVFFYSQYSTSWGVYCSNEVNCQRDANTNWSAYRV